MLVDYFSTSQAPTEAYMISCSTRAFTQIETVVGAGFEGFLMLSGSPVTFLQLSTSGAVEGLVFQTEAAEVDFANVLPWVYYVF